MPSAIVAAQTIVATHYLANNPNGANNLKNMGYSQEIIDVAQKDASNVNGSVTAINKFIGDTNIMSGKMLAVVNAMKTAGYWKTPSLGGELGEQRDAKNQWDNLTPDQKVTVANFYNLDLYKGNTFAELTFQEQNQVAKLGKVGEIVAGLVLGIQSPIAKATTHQPVSAAEIRGAVVTGLVDAAMAIGIGEVGEAITGVGRFVVPVLNIGAAAVNVPSTIKVLTNPYSNMLDVALASGGEGLLLIGGIGGISKSVGVVKTVATASDGSLARIVSTSDPLADAITAKQANLAWALRHNKLAFPKYLVLLDDLDQSRIDQLSAGMSISDLDKQLFLHKKDEEVVRIIEKTVHDKAIPNPKGIVFCRSIKHITHLIQFFPAGSATFVHSQMTDQQRWQNIRDFREGTYRYILVRDLFNEGIDIPETNLLVFMRYTGSHTVWLQQLGRGLRKTPNKDFVYVLDFVGSLERLNEVHQLTKRINNTPIEKENWEEPPERIKKAVAVKKDKKSKSAPARKKT